MSNVSCFEEVTWLPLCVLVAEPGGWLCPQLTCLWASTEPAAGCGLCCFCSPPWASPPLDLPALQAWQLTHSEERPSGKEKPQKHPCAEMGGNPKTTPLYHPPCTHKLSCNTSLHIHGDYFLEKAFKCRNAHVDVTRMHESTIQNRRLWRFSNTSLSLKWSRMVQITLPAPVLPTGPRSPPRTSRQPQWFLTANPSVLLSYFHSLVWEQYTVLLCECAFNLDKWCRTKDVILQLDFFSILYSPLSESGFSIAATLTETTKKCHQTLPSVCPVRAVTPCWEPLVEREGEKGKSFL